MKCATSYSIEMKRVNKILLPTVHEYRRAVSFLIDVYEKEWDHLKTIPVVGMQRATEAERLIHSTKSNTAKYDFDVQFKKFPSYLRRAARNLALGSVSSYHTRYTQWEQSGKNGKPPVLNARCDVMPCFYRGDMYKETHFPTSIYLKIFHNNDWVWYPFNLSKTDVQYIAKHCSDKKKSAPTLECRHKVWSLRFSFTKEVDLFSEDVYHQRVCAVDLGINTDAVCTIMEPDGTILARKFLNFPSDKDQLWTLLGRIKRYQRANGSKNIAGKWEYARNLNDQLAYKTASAIVETAVMYSCTTIVFEHLDSSGKIHGSRKQKLALWKKNTIQAVTMCKAHESGLRVSRVCAWNTSKYAYDGSGIVVRGKKAGFPTNAMCRFPNGRTYNSDLSASYNIGARYYCREILKTLDENLRSRIEAKVPGAGRRTSCVYADLLMLWKTFKEFETANAAA